MQTLSATDLPFEMPLDMMPPAFFPPEATEAPAIPLKRTAVSQALVDAAPVLTKTIVAPTTVAPLVALRIARAVTGETELRLLAKTESGVKTFFVRKSRIAPYKTEDIPFKVKKLTESRACELFEKMVADTYPAETLRNNKVVPIHQDLL